MPWSKSDYPDSMKNLEEHVRLKAIDIANAMVRDGYDENRAIPIAISQAKDWIGHASKDEKEELEDKNLRKTGPGQSKSSRLQDADVEVAYDEEEKAWSVKSDGAERVDSYHEYKKDAVIRGKEIIEHRDADLDIKKKND